MGWGFSKYGFFPKSVTKKFDKLLFGTPEKRENVSTLRPEQEPLYRQAVGAGLKEGAGGAFGTAADYYRSLFNDDSSTFNAYAAPEMRRFNEQIVPDLAEQFAGMGSGALSSSGFRNAAVGAGTDLSERLGAIRAQLRQQGAQGLSNIGQIGLGNYSQNMVTEQGTPGLLATAAPALAKAGMEYFVPGSSGLLNMGGSAQNTPQMNSQGMLPPQTTSFGLPSFSSNPGMNANSNWLSQSVKGKSGPYGRAPGQPIPNRSF